MKKLLTIALGLGVALGTTVPSFAQDSAPKPKKAKKAKKAKKTDGDKK